MQNTSVQTSGEGNGGSAVVKAMTRTEARLASGEAWVFCLDCNSKLSSFDGVADRTTRCPQKDSRGLCAV